MCHMCTNSVIAILHLHKEREGRETERGGERWRVGGGETKSEREG